MQDDALQCNIEHFNTK